MPEDLNTRLEKLTIGYMGEDRAEIEGVMERFPPGALVTIVWISSDNSHVYDEGAHGVDLGGPQPALLLRHLPEQAFSNAYGWVVPFECVLRGTVRVSTTYAAKVIGMMPQPGDRK